MKTVSKIVYTLIIPTIFFACGDDDGPAIFSSNQAASKALQIVSGQVTSTELDSAGVTNEWDVTVMTDAGSEIKIEFDQATGELLEIDGDHAPFTYEVNPGMGLIVFSQAKEIALGEVNFGEIQDWELKKDSLGNWVYEFDIVSDGDDTTVKICCNWISIITHIKC